MTIPYTCPLLIFSNGYMIQYAGVFAWDTSVSGPLPSFSPLTNLCAWCDAQAAGVIAQLGTPISEDGHPFVNCLPEPATWLLLFGVFCFMFARWVRPRIA